MGTHLFCLPAHRFPQHLREKSQPPWLILIRNLRRCNTFPSLFKSFSGVWWSLSIFTESHSTSLSAHIPPRPPRIHHPPDILSRTGLCATEIATSNRSHSCLLVVEICLRTRAKFLTTRPSQPILRHFRLLLPDNRLVEFPGVQEILRGSTCLSMARNLPARHA